MTAANIVGSASFVAGELMCVRFYTWRPSPQCPKHFAGQALGQGLRCNDTIKAFAERLKKAGKPPKVVIVACMRKLLTIMNSMLKNNAPWNPEIA